MSTALQEIDARAPKAELISCVKKHLGTMVTFTNGCQVDLATNDGVFWGQCPYGTTWACDENDKFAEKIANWVYYWNVPRDEGGTDLDISLTPALSQKKQTQLQR